METLVEWWKDSRPGRATYRYLYSRGALLCGGIAYSALFSLFAALTIGYTVFMQVLGGSQELMDAVFGEINELVPGLIAVDGEKGVIDPVRVTRLSLEHAASVAALLLTTEALVAEELIAQPGAIVAPGFGDLAEGLARPSSPI